MHSLILYILLFLSRTSHPKLGMKSVFTMGQDIIRITTENLVCLFSIFERLFDHILFFFYVDQQPNWLLVELRQCSLFPLLRNKTPPQHTHTKRGALGVTVKTAFDIEVLILEI